MRPSRSTTSPASSSSPNGGPTSSDSAGRPSSASRAAPSHAARLCWCRRAEAQPQPLDRPVAESQLLQQERVAGRPAHHTTHRIVWQVRATLPDEPEGVALSEAFELPHRDTGRLQPFEPVSGRRVASTKRGEEHHTIGEQRQRVERVGIRPVKIVDDQDALPDRVGDVGRYGRRVPLGWHPSQRSRERQVRQPRQRRQTAPFVGGATADHSRLAQKRGLPDAGLTEEADRLPAGEPLSQVGHLASATDQHDQVLERRWRELGMTGWVARRSVARSNEPPA